MELDDAIKVIFAFIGIFVGLTWREIFSRKREIRDMSRSEASSLHDVMELNYFGESIRANREKIDKAGGIDSELPVEDRDLYLLGRSLQQAGIRCLLSTTSLEHVLLGSSPQVVRDWVLVSRHIEFIRGSKLDLSSEIPFQRRHGEWLALIAYMWLAQQQYGLPHEYDKATGKFEALYGSKETILLKEHQYFGNEAGLLSGNTVTIRNRIRDGYIKSIYSMPRRILKTLQKTSR